MSSDYLFVYGLLRRHAGHEMSQFLCQHAQFISEATFQGKLYLIEYYPGIIASNNPDDRVNGDVFKLSDLSILEELDQFEGIGTAYESPHEYQRAVQSVALQNGSVEKAWVYLYNWSIKQQNQIHSGDFLDYLGSTK